MAKKFHARSILRPEKTKEEEKWENEEEERHNLKIKKAPTSVFEGINEDKFTRTSREAIMKDYSQDGREEEDEWQEERD